MPKRKVYLCGVDFQYELGEALEGTEVYADVEDLKEHKSCWKGCGIVELEINTKKHKWIEPQDFYNEDSVKASEIDSPEYIKTRIEHVQNNIQQKEKILKRLNNHLKELQRSLK